MGARGAPQPQVGSPLMQRIWAQTLPVAALGTVPRRWALSSDNAPPHMLAGSAAVFAAMRQLIAGAQREVLLQAFAWQDGSRGAAELRRGLQGLHQAQQQRRARGEAPRAVRVDIFLRRIYLSLRGGRDISRLQGMLARLDPTLVALHLWDHGELFLGLLHGKSLVVDAQRALICGANPQHHFDPHGAWFDSGCVMAGGDGALTLLRCSRQSAHRSSKSP
ncbi:MAG: hypothetical protein EOO40_05995, partial [Deltaproteobacteria bacterium]